jgi:hypothetical protein
MNKKISSAHWASDWAVDLADRHSPLWPQAIEIIRDRFESRYLKSISTLINNTDKVIKYNCGFLVMSLDCLFIETLNQFYLGLKKTTDRYYRSNGNANLRWNWQAFRDFFLHSSNFPSFKGNDTIVEVFFNEIRCGLLHQAESKTNSLINIREKQMLTLITANDPKGGIILNRNLFHDALVKEFEKYLNDLKNPDIKNIEGNYLRVACNEKMSALVR